MALINMKTGDIIIDLTVEEHKTRAATLGWKGSMYVCWGLEQDMANDHPYFYELTEEQRHKYELAYEVYWDFYKKNSTGKIK